MIPAGFDYRAPDSLDEAVGLLSEGGDGAKLLAGGHSLIPLMKLRLATPELLVDLRKLDELRKVNAGKRKWTFGALTTYSALQSREELGVVARAAALIADQQVRNRGTVGGSLAHGDPASDMPAVLLAAEGEVTAKGPGGERKIAAADLFQDLMTTALAPDEVLTEVSMPSLDGWGWGYEKFTRRAEDWAMVGVCALVKGSKGKCDDVRVSLINMGSKPARAPAVEEALRGEKLDAGSIEQAAARADEGTDPTGDTNASPEYKRHLAKVLTRRALASAAGVD